MLLNAIIIDDEPKNIRLLRAMIAELLPTVTVKGDANNIEAGIQLAKTLQPHIIFLDIRISEEDDGFSFFKAFKQPTPFEVVFVTAHDEFAIKAFDVNALDYLLKPVQAVRLSDTINKLQNRSRSIIKKKASVGKGDPK